LSDAAYDLTEAALREVIYIPSTFTYGQKPPVILVPGTGSKGCLTFGANFIKKLTGVSYADPIWLNIPKFLLDDAQVNAVRMRTLARSFKIFRLGSFINMAEKLMPF
jgi:hypothetical protein